MRNFRIKTNYAERNDTVNFIFKAIRNSKPMEKDEELQLAAAMRRGEGKAREQLITANLRFVASVAKAYQHCGLPLEDLIQEGELGLIEAIDRFDPERDCRIITFAVSYIQKHIISLLSQYNRLSKSICLLEGDAPFYDDEMDCSIFDMVASDYEAADAQAELRQKQEEVTRLLKSLPALERQIVSACYGCQNIEKSIAQLSLEYDIPESVVADIRDQAIRKMKEAA